MRLQKSALVTLGFMVATSCWGSDSTANIINGGFETGNLAGWQVLGDTSVQNAGFGATPPEGNYQALIVNHPAGFAGATTSEVESFLGISVGDLDSLGNGSATQGGAIKQIITANAGDALAFRWNYLSNEDPSSPDTNDFAFVSISSGSLTTLATTLSTLSISFTSFGVETGYSEFSYVFNASGTYTLGLGVVDVGDTDVTSGLLIDNVSLTPSAVPEPSSLILTVIGGVPIVSWYFGPSVKRALGKVRPSASPLPLESKSARPCSR